MTNPRIFSNPKGFTLVEVMIALVITVSAAILVSNAWSGNLMRVRKSTMYNNVSILLERKIIEIEARNAGKKIEEIKDEAGDFGADFAQYRWTFETQPYVMPDLTSLLSQDNKTSNEMTITMISKLQELTSKVILEGKVTVFVQAAGKEVSYSLTTYFIDFESPEIDQGIQL